VWIVPVVRAFCGLGCLEILFLMVFILLFVFEDSARELVVFEGLAVGRLVLVGGFSWFLWWLFPWWLWWGGWWVVPGLGERGGM